MTVLPSRRNEWVSRQRFSQVLERCHGDLKVAVQALFRYFRKRKKTDSERDAEEQCIQSTGSIHTPAEMIDVYDFSNTI
jgi:hypothetical protein